MKILLLNIWHIINAQGGAEKVFCDMANALSIRGHDVVALVLENKEGKPFFDLHSSVKFINSGIGFSDQLSILEKIKRACHINKIDRHLFVENLIDIRKAARIQHIINDESPDIIISFSCDASRILFKAVGDIYPVITMCHSIPEHYLNDCSNETLNAIKKSRYFQVLMPSFIDNARKYVSHKNIVCIPNSVCYSGVQCGVNLADKRKSIISIGRIAKVAKRQHLLIEAFNRIHFRYPDWKLELYGEIMDEEYFRYCIDLIRTYKLSDKVEYLGVTNNVFKILNEASIFAFPSAFEGFGLALAEAMSAGLPCVGFKSCSAVNELIRDGSNGILCEETVEDFARGLAELMDDADKRSRYGLQAKEDMKPYAPEKIWDQWEELINKTVYDYKMKLDKH